LPTIKSYYLAEWLHSESDCIERNCTSTVENLALMWASDRAFLEIAARGIFRV